MERSYKVHGFMISLLIHGSLFLLFFFFFLTTPNPPLSSFTGGGIELNFGELDAGTGDPTNLLETNPDPADESMVAAADNTNDESGEETPEDVVKDDITPSDNAEDVPVKTETKADPKKTTASTEKSTNTTTTITKSNEVNKNAVMTPNNKKGGDDLNKAGNPGNEKGLDERATMKTGNQGLGNDPRGTGGIGNADVPGWKLSSTPDPQDQSDESGTIIYEISVDADGIVVNAVPLERRGISPTTEKVYRKDVMNQTFERIDKSKVPPLSKGRFTYTIKSK